MMLPWDGEWKCDFCGTCYYWGGEPQQKEGKDWCGNCDVKPGFQQLELDF